MGCGESKHAIATENTLTKSKSKSKNVDNVNTPLDQKPTNNANIVKENVGNVKENEIPADAIKKEEKEPQPDDNNKGKETENAVEEMENPKKNTDDEKEKGIEPKDEKLEEISKNEEMKGEKKDNVIVEVDDQEGKEKLVSDYYPKKVGENDAVEGKEKDGEANSNKEKEEALKVEEGKELAPGDETRSSGEEKDHAAKDENVNAASATEVKAD